MAREQRRLAAIVAADVVGYSRLMGRDESGTLARLREHRKQRFEPTLARHGGRLVKLTGDGALAEFSSAVDALGAAIEFQQAMAEANRDQPEDTSYHRSDQLCGSSQWRWYRLKDQTLSDRWPDRFQQVDLLKISKSRVVLQR